MDRHLDYNILENNVLSWNLSGNHEILQELRQQYHSSRVKKRQFTGVGFYTDIVVPHIIPPLHHKYPVKKNFTIGLVGARPRSGNIAMEVGFVIFVKDGYLKMLEGYTYGDEPWPDDFLTYDIFYFSAKESDRMEDLNKEWKLGADTI